MQRKKKKKKKEAEMRPSQNIDAIIFIQTIYKYFLRARLMGTLKKFLIFFYEKDKNLSKNYLFFKYLQILFKLMPLGRDGSTCYLGGSNNIVSMGYIFSSSLIYFYKN